MHQMFYSTAYDSFLFDSSVQVVKSHDQTQPGRNGMPEEQSVHARDGAADPHGCGNSLRSGIPFLTLHPNPIAIVFTDIQKSVLVFATLLFHHLALSSTSLYFYIPDKTR